jgi:hypothetical protein
MKKELINEKIFEKTYDGQHAAIRVSELPTNLLPTDKIVVVSDEGYHSEDNSWDPTTTLYVYREREETDAEFEERKAWWDAKKEETRTSRYKDYLKLKQEFEEGLLTRGRYIMSQEEKEKFERYSNEKFNTEDGRSS